MAKSPILAIRIVADAKDATKGMQDATKSMDDLGAAADTASKKTRDISGGVDAVGGTAAQATTGMRDLGGAMSEMGGIAGTMGGAMVTAATATEALDGAATLYAAAQSIASGAAGAFTTVLNAMKIAILTNPIFIIAAIIIAIGAALVIAYMKCETFRRIVDAAFDAVAGAIQVVWDWITKLAGYVGGYFQTVFTVWKTVAKAAIDVVIAPFETLWEIIKKVVDWIKKIDFPEPPGWMKSIGGAIGGIFGKSASAAATSTVASSRALAPAVGARSSGGVVIQINTSGLGASAPEIQDAVVDALRKWSGRNGPLVDSRGAVGRYA